MHWYCDDHSNVSYVGYLTFGQKCLCSIIMSKLSLQHEFTVRITTTPQGRNLVRTNAKFRQIALIACWYPVIPLILSNTAS